MGQVQRLSILSGSGETRAPHRSPHSAGRRLHVCLTRLPPLLPPADNRPEDAQGGGVPPGRADTRPAFGCAEARGADDAGGPGAPVPGALLRQQENMVSTPVASLCRRRSFSR